jgi:hypothetical protein
MCFAVAFRLDAIAGFAVLLSSSFAGLTTAFLCLSFPSPSVAGWGFAAASRGSA